MRVYIDFETYSVVDLPTAGAYRYAEHPDTDILCLGYAVGDAAPAIWHPPMPFPEVLRRAPISVAHNAVFEWLIWNKIGTERLGWPPLLLENLIDTAAKARARGLPGSLDGAAKALGFPLKDQRLKKVMLTLSRPRTPTADDPSTRYTPESDGYMFQILYKYCRQDVEVTRQLDAKLPDLSATEQRVWQATLRANARGFPIDCQAIQQALAFIKDYTRQTAMDCKALTGATPSQTAKFLLWLHQNGALLENLRASTVADALARPDLAPPVRRALTLRKQSSRSSLTKFSRMRQTVCADGTIKGNLVYHGAATGRFNGSGVQLLNLPRGNGMNAGTVLWALENQLMSVFYDDPLDALVSAVRGVLCAPAGKRLLVADFGQIESRVLCWLAGEAEALDEFRRGLDPYKTMAASLYHIDYAAVNAGQRQYGKAMVLGCGFQQGPDSFVNYCAQSHIDISREEAEEAVKAYREKHPKVVKLWRSAGKAAIAAIQRPGRRLRLGRLQFVYRDDVLQMQLPSGRWLSWNQPVIKPKKIPGTENLAPAIYFMGVNPKTHNFEELDTYGGSIVQSAVQGIARDVMTEAWLRLEDLQFNIIGAVHDELIDLADVNDLRADTFCQAMVQPPEWAPDLPLVVSSWYAEERYRK